MGCLICGSANGVAITANKHKGIRAALCWQKEIAELTRKHNNANMLCLPARFVSLDAALEIIDTFLNTPFEGGQARGKSKQNFLFVNKKSMKNIIVTSYCYLREFRLVIPKNFEAR